MRVFIFILIFFTGSVYAEEMPLSAERKAGQHWEVAIGEAVSNVGQGLHASGALEFTDTWSPAIGGIPEWKYGLDALNDLFLAAKNIRYYDNPNPGDFRRKGAWLYPYDGCYSKAAHVANIAGNKGFIFPGKIYAFGNLRLLSLFSPNGKTTYWSYHVAAAYHIGSTIYVVDPSVSTTGVLTKSQWLARISRDPSRVRVSLCNSHPGRFKMAK